MTQSKIVVDSSVIVKWLNQDKEDNLDKADSLLADSQAGKIMLLAPALTKYEVGNVLVFSKKLSQKQADIALTELYRIPVAFIPQSLELALETFRLAFKLNITCYDASFLSLAKQYNATLVTDNIKDQGKKSEIKVISLKDY